MAAGKILIVDDEPHVLEVIEAYLKKDGFEVFAASTGSKALELYRRKSPDVIVLDLMLPDISGEEICTIIRRESRIPIIMLTAKSDEEERILGITMGADDYLVKPFSPRELVVRIHAILRRITPNEPLSDILSFQNGKMTIDTTKHEVTKNGQTIKLTPIEYRLLLLLAGNPGRTFTREEVITHVLGYDYQGYDRTIDTHIKNIRHKIEDDYKNPLYIKTVFGIGYRFEGGNP